MEGSNDSNQLKNASNAPEAQVDRALGKAGAPGDGANYARQVRNVGSKTFYQNGSAWTDAEVQARPGARRVQVKFGTEEYFALCRQAPEAAQWLSVGQNLQIAMAGVVYEITE